MSIATREQGLIQRIRNSAFALASRAKKQADARTRRAALVKEYATLKAEGERGGLVPDLDRAAKKAKERLDDAAKEFREAEEGNRAAQGALVAEIGRRSSRADALDRELRDGAPEAVSFCALARRCRETVRMGRVNLRAEGFTVETYVAACDAAYDEIGKLIHADFDPAKAEARIEELGWLLRLDLHVPAIQNDGRTLEVEE